MKPGRLLACLALCVCLFQTGGAVKSSFQEAIEVVPPPLLYTYLPMIQRPVYPPVLNPIENSDNDGFYAISWLAVAGATSYTLEEDTEPGFSTPTVIYNGILLNTQVVNREPGAYYYRVMATGSFGASPWSNIQSVIPPAGVWFLGNNTTFISGSNLVVVGEIHNNTASYLKSVTIIVNYYNGATKVATNSAGLFLKNIHPNERACYYVSVANPGTWTHYTFDGSTYSPEGARRPNLGVVSHSGSVLPGIYQVSGTIRNNESVQVKSVKGVATLFNAAGKVVQCQSASATTPDLNAGTTTTFAIQSPLADPGVVMYYRVQTDGAK